jgi:hypothetical protein
LPAKLPTDGASCGQCRFWVQLGASYGKCLAHPESLVLRRAYASCPRFEPKEWDKETKAGGAT